MAELSFALYGLHRGSSVDPEILTRRARLAEEAGFEALWAGDHIALPFDAPDPADEPRLETAVALTFMAAVTRRVRLGAGVFVLPQRQPVLLAKQLASLDVLCGGRLTVGVGVGYLEPELRAMGVDPRERGARADEFLAAMKVLWDDPAPVFSGRFVAFDGILQRPTPVQRPHPPIVVGGHTTAAYRRAITSANGWYGWELDPGQVAASLDAIRDVASRTPRPVELGELEISITPPELPDVATARRYAEIGVHRLVLQPKEFGGSEIDEVIYKVKTTLIDVI